MTNAEFNTLLENCEKYNTADEYIADFKTKAENHPEQQISTLINMIWKLHEDFNFTTVRKLSGLTQAGFSGKYKIAKRTIENWDGNKTQPALGFLLLLATDVVESKLQKAE